MAYPNHPPGASRRAVGAAADPPVDESDSDGALTGNHTDGVPVADLFARLTGEIPAVLQQHPDTEPDPASRLTAGRTTSTRRRFP